MTERVARHVVVRGHVQGVWFRSETQSTAKARGVDGWVRNLPDGTVEAHLEGPQDAVDAVLGWIENGGPSRAHVTSVDVRQVETTGESGFHVTR